MILLIRPGGTGLPCGISPPLGVLYLAGTLEANGIDCQVIDGVMEREETIIRALKRGPEIVGIPALSVTRWQAFDLAALVRWYAPKATVVIGGPHASVLPEQCKKHADVVVQGDGENQFLAICRGHEPIGGPIPIDSIPLPAWHKVNLWRYPGKGLTRFNPLPKHGVWIAKEPRIGLIASRGCNQHCRYCSSWWVQGGYRMRSPKLVVDEMGFLYSQGLRHFFFHDDSFYLDKEMCLGFCRELAARKMQVAYSVMTRADALDEEIVVALKGTGCYEIFIGIESADEKILEGMKKNASPEATGRTIKMCRRLGMPVCGLMIMGNIGETDATIEKSRRFLKDCRPSFLTIANPPGLWIYPGTAVYRQALREGEIAESFWDTREPVKMYGFTQRQLLKWLRRIHGYTILNRLRYEFGRLWGRIFDT
jgi:radical SAM superfamily enzyme YgiQ (UPF0313 family)